MSDSGEQIAAVAARLRYEDLPEHTVLVTKMFLLDSLGVMIAGSAADGIAATAAEVISWGGRPESRVGVFGDRLPAPSAALLNSAQIHGLDFDDTHDVAGVHANVSVIPAALAVAEKIGGIDGRQLITAVTLGVELCCRLGLSHRYYQGWHMTTLAGYFGSALAAAKILCPSPGQMKNALGIALSMAGGSVQVVEDGSVMKRIQPGFASQGGVMAALLAKRGIIGAKQIFDGKFGYFKLFDGYSDQTSLLRNDAAYSHVNLTADFGTRFESEFLSAKPYPCCRGNHAAIDATLELRSTHGIRASEVENVEVQLSQLIYNLVGRPFEIRDNAQVDAQFNVSYAIATALLTGAVTVGDYQPAALVQTDRKALADRVRVIINPEIRYKLPLHLTIRTKDGRTYSTTTRRIKGEPGTMTWADFKDKYDSCVSYSARPLPRAKELPAIIRELETVSDVGQLLALLTPDA